MNLIKYTYSLFLTLILLGFSLPVLGQSETPTTKDEDALPYPVKDDNGNYKRDDNSSNIDLSDPAAVKKNVDYDPVNNRYILSKTMGNDFYRDPQYISFKDYLEFEYKNNEKAYWKEKSDIKSELLRRKMRPQAFHKGPMDDMFPEDFINIKPSGSVEMSFSIKYTHTRNPSLDLRSRRRTQFEYEQDIRANITGKIGDLITLKFNYDTKASFEFDDQLKIAYKGKEDQIIRKFEAGNINFPLQTTLIQGSQSLFGFKTELQFGRLKITTAMAQQQGKSESISIQGGAQRRDFEIDATDYDANRHFFLSHFFRDNYEENIKDAPAVVSRFKVTRIEVWVTNDNRSAERSRDVLTLMDLGEPDSLFNTQLRPGREDDFLDNYYNYPSDSANALGEYAKAVREGGDGVSNRLIMGQYKMQKIQEFNEIYAKMLKPTEYTINPNLGYISLNRRLQNDEVLAVAFEYTYNGEIDGVIQSKIFRVGEFASEKPTGDESGLLVLKMLKSTSLNPKLPMWDLMMKNIYSLNTYQVSRKNFFLDIFYQDPEGGAKRYIPEGSFRGMSLIEALNLDRLDNYNQTVSNGVFDFLQGVTVDSTKGRMIFPMLEPFAGKPNSNITGIRNKFSAKEANLANKYAYDELYDSTITVAKNSFPEYNRFFMRGSYQATVTSSISLNRMNIPVGSVNVTAGGRKLTEGIDFSVDYVLGRVRILNESILNSGIPISVSFESSELFNLQQKRFMGTRMDYWISDNFTFGGTLMNLKEGVITSKNDYGEEPIKNTIWGLDGTYTTESQFLTKVIDFLPFLETKEKSEITFSAEYARLHPSYPKIISQSSYIDDFEGSRNFLDLKGMNSSGRWTLSSTPQTDNYPEAYLHDSLDYGKNRANLSWYFIKREIQQLPGEDNFGDVYEAQGMYVRNFSEKEIFKEKQNVIAGTPIQTLDLSFYPSERGPYNFDAENINQDGSLTNPKERWGGIMQSLQSTDFEATNYEYIEFWILDPFAGRESTASSMSTSEDHDGKLYIQLGNISEDILKDGKIMYENGMPTSKDTNALDTSRWGLTPTINVLNNAFEKEEIEKQDLGFDGLSDSLEQVFFKQFLSSIQSKVSDSVYLSLLNDPSSDNFIHPQDSMYGVNQSGILERHKYYGRAQGNSTGTVQETSTQRPETEDLNGSNSLDDSEDYFEYEISINKNDVTESSALGSNFVVDQVDATTYKLDNDNIDTKWIQFQVPLDEFTKKVGNIDDFRSIRFIRMYMTGFDKPITIRFARFGLVSNQWRKYSKTLYNGEDIDGLYDDDAPSDAFNLSVVNIEENSDYAMPPGVVREITPGAQSSSIIQQNEQSLSMNVTDLKDGDARAGTKIENLDLRYFKKMEMFIHANKPISQTTLESDLIAFIRIGSDNSLNYYEYQVPLSYSEVSKEPSILWPEENNLTLLIEDLTAAKIARNMAGFNNAKVFYYKIPENTEEENRKKIFLKGNPDLSKVKSIMIGIKNPAINDPNNPFKPDDNGESVDAEIWFNELRLSGFDVEGGSAALARLDIKLADFGMINIATDMHTQGFGGIEQSITERYRDNYQAYNVSTALELGKFLPKKSGITIPMYAGITESFSTPEYDPYTGDLKVEDLVASEADPELAEKLKRDAQTYNKIKNYSFEGVRKNATKKSTKKRFHDISNLTFTYRFLEETNTNPIVEYEINTIKTGIVGYNFNNNPKSNKPFAKTKMPRFIKDFNYQLAPKSVTFQTSLKKDHTVRQIRSYGNFFESPSRVDKQLNWNRNYGLKYTPSKSITAKYTASTNAFIKEPESDSTWADKKENEYQLWDEIQDLGRMLTFQQATNISYKLPFSKFKALNWITSTAKLNTSYSWTVPYRNIPDYGNIISNANTKSINASFSTRKLHKGLKSFGKKLGIPTYSQLQKKKKEKEKEKKEAEEAKAKGEKPKKKKTNNKNKKKKPSSKKKKQTTSGLIIQKSITTISKFSIDYTLKAGTTIPGFMPTPTYLGSNHKINAPGYPFAFGYQPYNNNPYNRRTDEALWESHNSYAWFTDPSRADWFSKDDRQVLEFLRTNSSDLSYKATISPIKKFNIDLNWKRNATDNFSEFFVQDFSDEDNPIWQPQNPMRSGTYKVSIITWGTAFQKRENNLSAADLQFIEVNRIEASKALQDAYGMEDKTWSHQYTTTDEFGNTTLHTVSDEDYKHGFGSTAQDVLIPAFLAAYTNKPINEFSQDELINPYPTRPLPNWKIRYTGLSSLKVLKPIFSRITINHSYKSMYSTSYIGEINFDQSKAHPTTINPNSGNFYSVDNISQVTISEKLAPLIGIDFQFKNGMSIRSAYNTSRNLNLSFVNYQLNETISKDIKIGFGYKFKNVPVPIKLQPLLGAVLTRPLDTKIDFSFRDNKNLIYIFQDGIAKPNSGTKSIDIKTSISYKPKDAMEIRIFADWRKNIPYTTTSYATTTGRYGVSFRYAL